jgi:hypothetical protein
MVEPEVVLAARIAREFSTLAPDAIRPPQDRQPRMTAAETSDDGGAAVPPLDTTFRASDVNAGGRPTSRWLVRALLAFVFALASAIAAGAWQYYGDTAQQMVAGYFPRLSLTLTSLTSSQPAPASESSTPELQAAAAEQPTVTVQAGPAPSATDATAQAAPTSPAEQQQLMQSMASDLASMKDQIGELKAVIDQLKASQDQMVAKLADTRSSDTRPSETRAVELAPRPRPAPQPALRAAAAALHKPAPPRPVYTPVQATPPQQPLPPPPAAAPMQLQSAPQSAADPQDEPVVRPPMPVR